MLVADIFVYLDDVQYTKKDWRNTNQLKSENGIKKVFVPISNASRSININEALISYNFDWQNKILNQLKQWYGKASFYTDIINLVTPILKNNEEYLVDLNYKLNKAIADYIGIVTPIYYSSNIPKGTEDRNDRILEICKHFNEVNLLYDGKSAASFLDTVKFNQNGIEVVFQNYCQTPYPQLWGKFETSMSILDLIMNNSPEDSFRIINASPLPSKISLHSSKDRNKITK